MTDIRPLGFADLPERIGRYEVRSIVGVGGFATVVRAYDPDLDDEAAIKILDAPSSQNDDLRSRFVAEARLLRRVRHVNVVAVYDVGELEDGRPYLVMELATGGALEERLPTSAGAVSASDIGRVVQAVAEGIGALHRDGVVHRDIKPANLLVHRDATDEGATSVRHGLLGADERIVISDLGFAKDQLRTSVGPTVTGGTPHYQAPEQARPGAEVSPPTDVYAATGLVWHLLTGDLPPLPSTLKTQLLAAPHAWRDFFGTGLAAEPEDRFASMALWADAARVPLGIDTSASTTSASASSGINPRGTSVGFSAPSPGATCPYKGLAAFQPEDAPFFHGRDSLIDNLVALLGSHRLLVIGGPSGSGKSSVLRAGLLPSIRSGVLPSSSTWATVLTTPGPEPLVDLHRSLHAAVGDPSLLPSLDELRSDPAAIRRVPIDDGLFLAIDQFEELFTLGASEQDRQCYLDVLRQLVDPIDSRVRVALALRADFYAECANHSWLANAINQAQMLVGPLSPAELRASIEEPAQQVGLRLEAGLVERVVADAGAEPGSLPLVAHALMETWLRRRGNTLTIAGFEAAGGVTGAIAQSAESAFQKMDTGQQAAARDLMLRLITPGEGAADTRARLLHNEMAPTGMAQVVADQLIEARLLTRDETSLSVAHERLISSWPRLREWIAEARDDLRLRQRVDRAARDWELGDQDADLLLRGTPLATFTEWAEREPGQLSPLARSYLDQSSIAEAAQIEANEDAERQRRKLRRFGIGALTLLTTAAVLASVVAVLNLGAARRSEQRAEQQTALAIGSASQLVAPNDPLLALNLAAESIAISSEPDPGARAGLITGRQAMANWSFIPSGSPIPVGDALTATITRDGQFALVGTRDGRVTVIAAATNEPVAAFVGHSGAIEEIAVSPDGRVAASSGTDGEAWLWDLRQLDSLQNLDVDDSPMELDGQPLGSMGSVAWSVAFSPDSSELAVSSENGILRRFSVDTGAPLGQEMSSQHDLLSVAYAGNRMFVGTGTGRVLVFDPEFAEPVADIAAHGTTDVWELLVDESVGLLFSVANDRTVRAWDLASTEQAFQLFTEAVDGAPLVEPVGLINIGEGRLAIGTGGGRVHEWDTASAGPVGLTPPLHTDAIIDAAIADSGLVMVTLSNDQRLRFLQRGLPTVTQTIREGTPLYSVATSDDGTTSAVGRDDGVIELLTRDGSVIAELSNHEARVVGLTFIGEALISADVNGEVRRWVDGEVASSLSVGGAVRSLDLHPTDGRLLLVTPGQVHIAPGDLSGIETIVIGGIQYGAFAGPDHIVGAVAGNSVRRFDLDGVPVSDIRLIDEDAAIRSITARADGRFMAVATSLQEVVVWELDSPDLNRLAPHDLSAIDVAFAPDGVTVVGTSQRGTVSFWDHKVDDALGQQMQLHDNAAVFVAIDQNGWMITAGTDGRVTTNTILDVAVACDLAAQTFDQLQQRTNLGESEPIGCN